MGNLIENLLIAYESIKWRSFTIEKKLMKKIMRDLLLSLSTFIVATILLARSFYMKINTNIQTLFSTAVIAVIRKFNMFPRHAIKGFEKYAKNKSINLEYSKFQTQARMIILLFMIMVVSSIIDTMAKIKDEQEKIKKAKKEKDKPKKEEP